MSEQLQAIATVLSLVNPAICAAIFSKIEAGRTLVQDQKPSGRGSHSRIADAFKSMIAVFVILSLAALVGVKVLEVFGVSLDAFSVAGGFVLAWMGFGMLKGDSPDSGALDSDRSGEEVSLTPLIMFAASPGTITGVITLAVAHSKTEFPTTALIATGVTAIITFGAMLVLSSISGKKQGGLVHETVTRFMGLIVIAMGVQFALTGIKSFMA